MKYLLYDFWLISTVFFNQISKISSKKSNRWSVGFGSSGQTILCATSNYSPRSVALAVFDHTMAPFTLECGAASHQQGGAKDDRWINLSIQLVHTCQARDGSQSQGGTYLMTLKCYIFFRLSLKFQKQLFDFKHKCHRVRVSRCAGVPWLCLSVIKVTQQLLKAAVHPQQLTSSCLSLRPLSKLRYWTSVRCGPTLGHWRCQYW